MANKEPKKEFALQIHTPSRIFYDDKAESLIVKSMYGSMGVMHNTMPIVTVLTKGVAQIRA
ncbi:MAG: hypothetical protein FWD76_03700, partial [Firmicutes bacterium]|nr:hypothetical protein [Bacillota bacterium]